MLSSDTSGRKRLAYLVSHGASYASNGYAIRTQGIASALQQAGLEVLCMVRPGRPWEMGPQPGDMPLEVIVEGIRYLHSRWPEGRPETLTERISCSARLFVELFRVFKPDLVLAASNFEVAVPALLAAQQLQLPFAYEVRGFWEISQSSRDPAFAKLPEFQHQLQAESWLVQQAIPLFTLNAAMQQELIRRGANPQHIQLVPNGIGQLPPLPRKDPALAAQYGLEPGDRVFGYIGSLTSYEGLDDLLSALALLPPAKRWKLLLVGAQQPQNGVVAESDQSLSGQLLAQAQQLGIANRLCFTGRVSHQQVGCFYGLIDTLVLPRKNWPVCQLVMPLKGIEALSYGMQLLVSDVAPLRDLQQLSASVQCFAAGDVVDLARQLGRQFDLRLTMDEREQIRQMVWLQHQYARVCQPMVRWSETC